MSLFKKKKNNFMEEFKRFRVVGILEEDYHTLKKRELVSVRYEPETQQCVICSQTRPYDDEDGCWTTSIVKRIGIKSSEWRREGHLLTIKTANSVITVRIPEEEYERASNIIEVFTKSMIA